MTSTTEAVGKQFGHLLVLYSTRAFREQRRLACECSCGKTVSARFDHVVRGKVRSCGCQRGAYVTADKVRHGHSQRDNRTPEYGTWIKIRERCAKPGTRNFADYGGRGITVCERWLVFENFLADMGERPSDLHSIERKDNSAGYSPNNCVWATRTEQARNRRSNHVLLMGGESMSAAAWAERTGLDSLTILARVRRGWTHDAAISTPLLRLSRRRRAGA